MSEKIQKNAEDLKDFPHFGLKGFFAGDRLTPFCWLVHIKTSTLLVTNTATHSPNQDIVQIRIVSIHLQIYQNHVLLCHQ